MSAPVANEKETLSSVTSYPHTSCVCSEHVKHVGFMCVQLFLTQYLNVDGDGCIRIHLPSVLCRGSNPLS